MDAEERAETVVDVEAAKAAVGAVRVGMWVVAALGGAATAPAGMAQKAASAVTVDDRAGFEAGKGRSPRMQ